MRPLSLSRISHSLFFFATLLVGLCVRALPVCQGIDGIRYCNPDFWTGRHTGNLVGATSISSLPSGEVSYTLQNICPSSQNGGTLYKVEHLGNEQHFTNATLINGDIWGQHPPSTTPPTNWYDNGQKLDSELGRIITFTKIFTPAMYVYWMGCHYAPCFEGDIKYDYCQWNAYYLVGINITNTPVTPIDLTLGPILIPGAKTDENNSLPIIPVGVPTQVNVPISINFSGTLPNAVLNSSVPVTLQIGIYSSTQNISIASLVANQNTMLVSFLVMLQSNEVGLQTLVAAINSGKTLTESNYTNNDARQGVTVQNQYRLVKEVQVDDHDGIVNIAPSRENGCRSNIGSIVNIKIICLKRVPGSTVDEIAEGCKIKTDLLLGNFLGGHITSASSHDQSTRPKGRFDPDTNADFIVIPKTGLDLRYFASQISGSYVARFDGKDPNGAKLNLASVVFRVATQTPFVPLTTIRGLNFHEMNSHPGDGFYGRYQMYNEVTAAINTYFFNANRNTVIRGVIDPNNPILSPYDNPRISHVFSQGVSLHFGGLFDVGGRWASSNGGHCGHRKGIEMDISLSQFTNRHRDTLKRILAESIREQELEMEVPHERPEDLDSDHWHVKLMDE